MNTSRQNSVLVEPKRFNIRYGTVNHFLSQFYYLCLGYREENLEAAGPGVDVVLAGHAHWSPEFRLAKPAGKGSWKPHVSYGRFSQEVERGAADQPGGWWGPLLLQTAACGPRSSWPDEAKAAPPPVFRYITVDSRSGVRRLRTTTLGQMDELVSRKGAARETGA